MSNSACRCQYEIIKSFTSIKVFFKPRDLDKGVQPIILVRARFFDYRERRNKRYLAFSLGGLWASGRLSSIFFTQSNSSSRSYFPLSLALSTQDETTGRSFISPIFRQTGHETAQHFLHRLIIS